MKESLRRDVKNTVGNIYSLNAPHAIGYVFNATDDEKSIAQGMYINSLTEITDNPKRWDFFVNKKGNIERISSLLKRCAL